MHSNETTSPWFPTEAYRPSLTQVHTHSSLPPSLPFPPSVPDNPSPPHTGSSQTAAPAARPPRPGRSNLHVAAPKTHDYPLHTSIGRGAAAVPAPVPEEELGLQRNEPREQGQEQEQQSRPPASSPWQLLQYFCGCLAPWRRQALGYLEGEGGREGGTGGV